MNIQEINSVKKLKDFIQQGGNINEKIKSKYSYEENILIHLLRKNTATFKLIKEIINSGIEINYINSENENALFYIQKDEKLKIVNLLIQAGIDINHLNKKRQNALLVGKIPPNVIEAYIKNDMNIYQVDKFGANFFDRKNDNLKSDIFKILKIGLENYHNTYPNEVLTQFFNVFSNEQAENNYIIDKLKKNNFNFENAYEHFKEFYDFSYKMEKFSGKEGEDKIKNINFLFIEIFKEIEMKETPQATLFKESFMNRYLPDLRSQIQKELLEKSLKTTNSHCVIRPSRI